MEDQTTEDSNGGKTLTKDILVETLSEKVGFAVNEAKKILETLLEEVKMSLEKGESVKISNFGKWEVREKKPRRGRNPSTGESLMISARRVVTFHPSEKLRAMVNDSDADPSSSSASESSHPGM